MASSDINSSYTSTSAEESHDESCRYNVEVLTGGPKQLLQGMQRKLELYTKMYHACFLPATTQTLNINGDLLSRRSSIAECMRKRDMLAKPTVSLLEGVKKGVANDMLEYGLRCVAPMIEYLLISDESLVCVIASLASGVCKEIESNVNISRKVFSLILCQNSSDAQQKAVAANCIIYLRLTYFFDDDDDPRREIDLLSLAEMSCEYGLFTHTCFRLVKLLLDPRCGAHEEPCNMFPNFRTAWKVFQEETGIQHPKLGQCAACGFTPENRGSLRKCGGKCPTMKKPVYCDQRCQKKDWSNHRKWCKIEGRETFVRGQRHF